MAIVYSYSYHLSCQLSARKIPNSHDTNNFGHISTQGTTVEQEALPYESVLDLLVVTSL